MFVCLNPSKATSSVTDATTQRCERIATTLGFGSILIANLFAVLVDLSNAHEEISFAGGTCEQPISCQTCSVSSDRL